MRRKAERCKPPDVSATDPWNRGKSVIWYSTTDDRISRPIGRMAQFAFRLSF